MVALRSGRLVLLAVSGVAIAGTSGAAQSTDPRSRASVASNGDEGNNHSTTGVASRDGRHVAFASFAGNLGPGGPTPYGQIYARDRSTGTTVVVSVDSNGVAGNQWSRAPAISADGRFVAFESDADNLVAGDDDDFGDVFIHDRDPDGNGVFDEGNGVTTRVSEAAGGGDPDGRSETPSISADGALVAFSSWASDLVSGKTTGSGIFVRDLATGVTSIESVDSNGNEGDTGARYPSLSGDGCFVAFWSFSTNLVSGDTNGVPDIFVHDRVTGATVRASVDSAGVQADFWSYMPSISGDGSRIVFTSQADNLSPFDNKNHSYDVFLHDFATGATTLLSVNDAGNSANHRSWNTSISEDGQTAVFVSPASNLSPNDLNGDYDVFVRDLAAGTTAIVSQTAWLASAGCPGAGFIPTVSGDGRCVVFTSGSADLVPGDLNQRDDVFVYDRSIPEPVASAVPYGAGYPGTYGIPSLSSSSDPIYGAITTLDVGNSAGTSTPALLAFGFGRASTPTRAGGTLLVDVQRFYVVVVPPLGLSMSLTVPLDPALCGLVVDLQALELDPGAAYGISFTPGLEWTFGN